LKIFVFPFFQSLSSPVFPVIVNKEPNGANWDDAYGPSSPYRQRCSLAPTNNDAGGIGQGRRFHSS
jgi:hypothetical protein